MYPTYSYTVEHHEHGILIRSAEPFPLDCLTAVGNLAEAKGFTQMHPGVAESTKARFAFTSIESGPLWAAELRERAAARSGATPLSAWFAGNGRAAI